MKKIEAIIKPFKLSQVKEALHELGISGMTLVDVKGFGRQRGSTGGIDPNDGYDDEFLAKMKLEVIVEDNQVDDVIESIKTSAYSGKIGDGKIFVSNIEQVIRIRTLCRRNACKSYKSFNLLYRSEVSHKLKERASKADFITRA